MIPINCLLCYCKYTFYRMEKHGKNILPQFNNDCALKRNFIQTVMVLIEKVQFLYCVFYSIFFCFLSKTIFLCELRLVDQCNAQTKGN